MVHNSIEYFHYVSFWYTIGSSMRKNSNTKFMCYGNKWRISFIIIRKKKQNTHTEKLLREKKMLKIMHRFSKI